MTDANARCALFTQAVRTIEQGHVRIGPSPITDPAMMVTRNMEDFITWVDGSSRKRTIMKYNDEVSGDRFDGLMRDHAERLLKGEIAPLLVYLSWTISIFYRRSG